MGIPKLWFVTSFLFSLFSFVFHAQAVGISVSPPAINLKGAANEKLTGTFTVSNPSRETVVYEITNDGLLTLMVTPTTFLLEPDKQARVTIEYRPGISRINHTAAQQLTTNLSILGRPLTVTPTQAASGIKLPITITTGQVAGISARSIDPLIVAMGVTDAILLIWLGLLLIRRYKRKMLVPKRTV